MSLIKLLPGVTCAISILLTTGCGTAISLSGSDGHVNEQDLIYGGTHFDLHGAFDPNYMQHIPFGKWLCFFDIPLSLACDTIALPYTATVTLRRDKPTTTPTEIPPPPCSP